MSHWCMRYLAVDERGGKAILIAALAAVNIDDRLPPGWGPHYTRSKGVMLTALEKFLPADG